MKLNATVYTTNKKLFLSSIDDIRKRISLAKNIELDKVQVVGIDFPKDAKTKQDGTANRIDFDWLKETYETEGNILCLHLSRAEHDKLKLKHPDGGRLGGSYDRNIGDFSIDFFIVADTIVDIVRKFTHELGHGISHWLGILDRTHEYDYEKKDLDALYHTFDGTDWTLKYTWYQLLLAKVGLLKLKIPQTLHKRLPDPYNSYISQDYGVLNPIYKMTGRHIGIDYACPSGTPVYAPFDGEVIVSGNHSDLGNFCYYQYIFCGKTRVERFLHLSAVPTQKKYKRGATVAFSGSSGMSTGPHLHVDGWYKEVSTSSINKTNWNSLTYNPHID